MGPAHNSERLARRLTQLMAARLALLAVLMAASLLVLRRARGVDQAAEHGLIVTAGCGFLSVALFAWAQRRVRRTAALGAAQLIADVALVTAFVGFSGASESILTFLYVPITIAGAMLFGRLGAYLCALGSSGAFGLLLLAIAERSPTAAEGGAAAEVQLAVWAVHGAALLLVALLASALTRELDRTDRALHERTRDLGRLRRLYERTVESLTSGLLTTDAEGRVTSFNPEAERITGIASGEALGRSLDAVIPGARSLVIAPHEGRDPGGRLRARLRFRNRRGEELWLGLAGSLLREADGSPVGHVVIFQDVTRVVEMERELRKRERLAVAGQLAADLAHEIRNPLAAVSGSIQMLRSMLAPGGREPEGHKLMGIVLRETERLNRLLGDFLEYARPRSPQREPVGVAKLLEEAVSALEPVRGSSVEVSWSADPSLVVAGDEGQLRQMLWNLLLNALEAMPRGGRLSLEAFAVLPQAAPGGDRNRAGGRREVEIVVADTGVGIPESVIERIFDPFFTTKREGTGLGLATVHRIVEAHGGSVSVRSREGEGAEFRIRLPQGGEDV